MTKEEDEKYSMTADAFIRSLAVNRGKQISIILGAGASMTSGMPSAQRCIWEWKQEIFVTRNPALRDTVGELSLPGTKRRIQRWLDQQRNFPAEDSPDEYSHFALACYPTPDDRKSYFHHYIAKASPHVGYKLLAQLIKHGTVRTIWTTNFDALVARACSAADVVTIEVGIDSARRAVRPHQSNEVRVVSLHGDFRYDALKNTSEELKDQEEVLKTELLHELRDHDLIVIGYSGRDTSLMASLTEAYSERQETRLFWCGLGDEIPKSVQDLIQSARAAGRQAFYVPTEGFDDLISRASLRILSGSALDEAKNLLATMVNPQASSTAFALPRAAVTALIKSNAYVLTYPTTAFQLKLQIPIGKDHREWLELALSDSDIHAVGMGDHHLAIGPLADINKKLGAFLRSPPILIEMVPDEVIRDNRIQSLLRRSFIKSVAKHLKCQTDGIRRVWECAHYDSKLYESIYYKLHKALGLRLRVLDGKLSVTLMPEVVVTDPNGALSAIDVTKIIRGAVYGYQHNNVFDSDLMRWAKRVRDVAIPVMEGVSFKLSKMPLYAGISEAKKNPLSSTNVKHAKQHGHVLSDASLVFSSKNSTAEVRSVSPLMGLVNNRPWDFNLTASGLAPDIETSVICPAIDAARVKTFLQQMQERVTPPRTEQDYLHEFPGFTSAFGLPLKSPNPGDPTWIALDDRVDSDGLIGGKQLAQRICRSLDTLRSFSLGTVALIYVPSRWEPYKSTKTDTEHFNLHDYVKAYAARQGQSTQFVRQETVISPQPCRVRWWLSLALYAKSMRTPWRLDCLEEDTAFVGIGYSIDSDAEIGSHVLLGCSHLYSARGEGLQFRLGRIDNPIMRGKNPFMSLDDARRSGETIRQLFFDARMKIPSRVVIHKRTPFIKEERLGLLQGLEGVTNVELVEVNIEESLRYVASKVVDGSLAIDNFPVSRGTLVLLGHDSALLWVHGSAPNASNPKFKYYQGKRRIPTPLLIRRHSGQSDLVQLATEILGLSKMNWNTFDYYSRLPATLDSANSIAKIGAYLGSFTSAPYDYRLLI